MSVIVDVSVPAHLIRRLTIILIVPVALPIPVSAHLVHRLTIIVTVPVLGFVPASVLRRLILPDPGPMAVRLPVPVPMTIVLLMLAPVIVPVNLSGPVTDCGRDRDRRRDRLSVNLPGILIVSMYSFSDSSCPSLSSPVAL